MVETEVLPVGWYSVPTVDMPQTEEDFINLVQKSSVETLEGLISDKGHPFLKSLLSDILCSIQDNGLCSGLLTLLGGLATTYFSCASTSVIISENLEKLKEIEKSFKILNQDFGQLRASVLGDVNRFVNSRIDTIEMKILSKLSVKPLEISNESSWSLNPRFVSKLKYNVETYSKLRNNKSEDTTDFSDHSSTFPRNSKRETGKEKFCDDVISFQINPRKLPEQIMTSPKINYFSSQDNTKNVTPNFNYYSSTDKLYPTTHTFSDNYLSRNYYLPKMIKDKDIVMKNVKPRHQPDIPKVVLKKVENEDNTFTIERKERTFNCYRCGQEGHTKAGCKRIIKCAFCSGNHNASDCRKLITASFTTCQICCKEGHLATNCSEAFTDFMVCQYCKKRGHIASNCKNVVNNYQATFNKKKNTRFRGRRPYRRIRRRRNK